MSILDEVEEIDEGVYEQAQTKKGARSRNYTMLEDQILIKAWSAVSLDACTGTSQTAKRYWQRIEDQYFRVMGKHPNKTPRTFRPLQGRWDVIKPICSPSNKFAMHLQVEPWNPTMLFYGSATRGLLGRSLRRPAKPFFSEL
jgi:hypothetical protein